MVETALRLFLQPRPKPRKLRPLPTFDSGGAYVDVADRDAPLTTSWKEVVLAVDTNVFVYAADIRSPFHDRRLGSWLERQRELPDAWFSSWPISTNSFG